MNFKHFLIVAAVMLFARVGHGQTSRWVQIYADTDLTISVDTTSQTVDSGFVFSWTKWQWTHMQSLKSDGSSYLSEMKKSEVDCRQGRVRLLQIVYYDDGGKAVWSGQFDKPWYFPTPETLGEFAMRGECKIARGAKLISDK